MIAQDRKAALAAYRERPVFAGVYALRCAAAGRIWVGTAPDLDTIRNRLWFQLKMNASPHRNLQAAWNEHGADCLTFEILERLDEEELPYVRNAELKTRARRWSGTLEAELI